MPSQFQPNLVAFKDPAGFGAWLDGHAREHSQFLQILAKLPAPVLLPDYPLLDFGDTPLRQRVWLDTHGTVHDLLRVQANYTGIDLSVLDTTDESAWYIWHDAHVSEHQFLEQFFGVT